MNGWRIVDLAARPEHVADVAAWVYAAFVRPVRADLPVARLTELFRESFVDRLPVRLLALAAEQPVGSVFLLANDLKCRSYTPWLAALYVAPAWRGRGIGAALTAAAQERARGLGYETLYLRTEETAAYYAARGWRLHEQCRDEYGRATAVFRYALGAGAREGTI